MTEIKLSQEINDIIKIQSNWRKCCPDNPPCAKCKKIILEVPVHFFSNDKKSIISFHPECLDFKTFGEVRSLENLTDLELSEIYCRICDNLKDCNFFNKKEKEILRK